MKNSEDGKKYALELLEKNTTKTIDPQIVTTCLNIVKNSEDGKKYALELLKKNTIKYIGFQLLSTSLNIVKKSKYGKEYALKLLKKNRNNDLDKEVISSCLNILVDSDEGKQYAIELLEKNRKENLAYQIVSSCLNILVDSDEGKQYAIELLEKSNYKNLHWGIVWQSLRIYAQFKIETNIINQIISNYNRKPSTDAEFNNYLQILKIPFFHNDEWLHEVNMRTKKWRVENRRFITSILIAYEYYPNESIQICNDILDNWKWEVNYQYKQHGIVELWKHIEISINHISLEKKAKEKAFEIISYDSAEPNIIPKILLDSCINIIDTPKG